MAATTECAAPYIASANGRLEAEQVEIATKFPGRIAVLLAKEGDMVNGGAVVARMDTVELEAQLRSAEAQVRRSEQEKAMAEALIAQRDSERIFAAQELQRTTALWGKGGRHTNSSTSGGVRCGSPRRHMTPRLPLATPQSQ